MLSKPLSPPVEILSAMSKKIPGSKTPPDTIRTVPDWRKTKSRLVPSCALTTSTAELSPDKLKQGEFVQKQAT